MSRRRTPPAGGMRIVSASPEASNGDTPGPDEDTAGGSGFWGFIGWWFGLLVGTGAVLALIAGFWGLYLAASALWHGMGL